MMPKSLIAVLAFSLILASAFTAVASQEAAEQETEAVEFGGILKEVDTISKTVIVETVETPQVAFSVESTTEITVNGEKVTFADLEAGQTVSVYVEIRSGKVLAIDAKDAKMVGR
jgi:hypothetical protein